MKPRNFPGRKERRQQRAAKRKAPWLPQPGWIEQPTDIRIRMGAKARAA